MEDHEVRIKRLRMRSWRRGMKEMDMILGPFADTELASLPDELLEQYERIMAENDQDLFLWIMARVRGEIQGPPEISDALDVIAQAAFGRLSSRRAKTGILH